MAKTEEAKSEKEGPNYPKVIGLSVVGGAIGAGIGYLVQLKGVLLGAAGGGGFMLALAGLLSVQALQDTKKSVASSQVKRKTEEAWNSQALGRNDKAEKLLLEALTAAQPLGEQDLLVLATTHSLANLYRYQKKFSKAETYFAKSTSIYGSLKLIDLNAALCYRDYSQVLLALDKPGDALESINKALAILEKDENRDLVEALGIQASVFQKLSQPDKANTIYLKVRSLLEKMEGPSGAQALRISLTIARCHRDQKQLAEALDIYKDLLGRLSKSERPHKGLEAEALIEMAEICTSMGQLNNVEPLLITALKVLQQYIGPRDDLVQRFFKIYKETREKLNLGLKEDDFLYLFSLDREKIRATLAEKPALAATTDKSGWGPLQWSCFLGRDDLIKWLLRNGAKLDDYDATKVLGPIHVAAAWGKGGQVTALLDGGAAIDSPGPMGWTPLLFAAGVGRVETVDLLLTRGANITVAEQQGRTALHLAAEAGRTEAVTLLLGKGCDPNAREDKYGQTPLHLAVVKGHGSTVEVLINNRADLFVRDKNGRTAADLADIEGHSILFKAIQFQEKLARGEIKDR